MGYRTINIPLMYLERAASDPDFSEALALTLMIKANYQSSVLMDYSLRRLQSLIHLNFMHLRKVVANALEFGLVKIISYRTVKGKDRTDMVAQSMIEDMKCVSIYICDSDFGKQIYLHSNIQDNRDIYSRAVKRQTLKDVSDLILLSALFVNLNGYDKKYDAEKWHESERLRKKARRLGMQKLVEMDRKPKTMGLEHYLNTGYSYDKMGDVFYGTLTRYKIMKLVKRGIEDGLFTCERNDMLVKYDNPYTNRPMAVHAGSSGVREAFEAMGEAYAKAMKAEQSNLQFSYNKFQTVANLRKRGYQGLIVENGEQKPVWFMRMANSYHICSDALRWMRRPHVSSRKKTKAYNRDHVR